MDSSTKSLSFRLTVVLMLLLYGGAALAAAQNGLNIGPKAGITEAFATGGQGWWNLIATIGMWVCVIGGGILYFAGKPEYVRWAVVGFIIFAFGDHMAKWVLSLGGKEIAAGLEMVFPYV